jgi:2-polyprenyl-3-methyl-5-hydroxy-6-metoxy-1,4-benzoquinol methylase
MRKLNYQPDILREVYRRLRQSQGDEMAIPSYLHANPMIPWLVSQRMHTVLKILDLHEKQNLLDFGCGVGILLLQIPENVINYFGVDLVIWPARMVLEAHGRHNFHLLDAVSWVDQIPDKSIDSIVAIEVLEHVPNIAEVASIFKRILKPGGKLVISGPTENFFYQIARKIAGFSGDYHRRNIYAIMQEIEAMGFKPDNQSRLVSIPWLINLFVICSYTYPKED